MQIVAPQFEQPMQFSANFIWAYINYARLVYWSELSTALSFSDDCLIACIRWQAPTLSDSLFLSESPALDETFHKSDTGPRLLASRDGGWTGKMLSDSSWKDGCAAAVRRDGLHVSGFRPDEATELLSLVTQQRSDYLQGG